MHVLSIIIFLLAFGLRFSFDSLTIFSVCFPSEVFGVDGPVRRGQMFRAPRGHLNDSLSKALKPLLVDSPRWLFNRLGFEVRSIVVAYTPIKLFKGLTFCHLLSLDMGKSSAELQLRKPLLFEWALQEFVDGFTFESALGAWSSRGLFRLFLRSPSETIYGRVNGQTLRPHV